MTSGTVTFTIVLTDPPRVCVHYYDAKTDFIQIVHVEDDPRARSISERDTMVVVQDKCLWTPRERIGGRPLLKAVALNQVRLKATAAQETPPQEQVNRLAELEPSSDTPPTYPSI